MSLRVNFITPAWEMKAACLETAFLPDDHTSENIKETFENLIKEWEIQQSAVECVTTDNGTNMKAAFKSLLPSNWLSCFGHNLNLALGKALKIDQVDASVRACRSVVQGFNHGESWQKSKQTLIFLNIPWSTTLWLDGGLRTTWFLGRFEFLVHGNNPINLIILSVSTQHKLSYA